MSSGNWGTREKFYAGLQKEQAQIRVHGAKKESGKMGTFRKFSKNMRVLLPVIIICCGIIGISAWAAEIPVCWNYVNRTEICLIISGNTAKPVLRIEGNPEAAKIAGTLKLVDDTTNDSVGEWHVSVAGSSCFFEIKPVAVTAGHEFTLSFDGCVYDADGHGEYVDISDSARGNSDGIPNIIEDTEIETEENRIITPETVPEKPVVKEFRSMVLNEDSTDILKTEYAMETLFDCPYIKDGKTADISQIALHGRTAEVYMHEDTKGWELEKGSTVCFSVQSASDDTDLNLNCGIICDGNIISTAGITEINSTQSLEIKEPGTYYFFMMNCGDTDQMLRGIHIAME